MMSRWRMLAQIEWRHDYYADGLCRDFVLTPTRATAQRLDGLHLRCKTLEDRFLLLVEVDAENRPVLQLPEDLRLVFRLDLETSSFLTVSNVDEDLLRRQRYHFSNRSGHATGLPANSTYHLSRPLAGFDAGRKYRPGDLVVHSGQTYECIKTAQAEPPDAAESAFWLSRGTAHYASPLDLVPLQGRKVSLTLAAPSMANRVRISGLNAATGAYDHLLSDTVMVAGASSSSITVDLSPWPAGRYRIDVNGEIFEAYHDDDTVNAFGVLELFHALPPGHPLAWLDATGRVREITYTVRFANRCAYWRYLTPLRKIDDIRPNADHAQPSPFTPGSLDPALPAQKDFFLSKQPLPLSEVADIHRFDLLLAGEARPAPKPNPHLPGMLTRNFDPVDRVYTDSICTIRLNH